MSSSLEWYPTVSTTLPYFASYDFPEQANKAQKSTPRINPIAGSIFYPNSVTRLNLPATGYMNTANTFVEFDVTLIAPQGGSTVRIQNGITSLINRLRILYGGKPIEDLQNYNEIVRFLQDHISTNQNGVMDNNGLCEGIGGYVLGQAPNGKFGFENTRQRYIQGWQVANPGTGNDADFIGGTGIAGVQPLYSPSGVVPGTIGYTTRRYMIPLAAGIFVQRKLIPLKYMASQFQIEITWADPTECLFCPSPVLGAAPTYVIDNINVIPELLDFDPTYDNGFESGLIKHGIPFKFCSWETYTQSIGKSTNINFHMGTRARSIKAIFLAQKRAVCTFNTDSGASFFDTANGTLSSGAAPSTMKTYQVRAGGKLYPPAPVELNAGTNAFSNGGAEAYVELGKALAIGGDYRLQPNINNLNWCMPCSAGGLLPEYDYKYNLKDYDGTGKPIYDTTNPESSTNAFCGTCPSNQFICAISMETSNGAEISGLNAQEQNDLQFMVTWGAPQATGSEELATNARVYIYYDAMLVLKSMNNMELVV